jgi:S-adenosylmethionine hydrolase
MTEVASPRHEFVSFLTDYGRADEFVGVCRSVMLSIAPHLRIIDVTHDVPAHDVRAGALTLVRAAQYLPVGIILAVIDPGVGSERRCVAVQTERAVFIGPDNGLLAPAVAMLGGATRAVSLTNPEYQIDAPGPTFAGRDVMAPAAGFLAAGVPLEDLGEPVDPISLTPGMLPVADIDGETVRAEVWWVDRFGNAQLNVGPEVLVDRGIALGDPIELTIGDRTGMVRWVHTYADAKPSELVVLVDSYGLLSVSLDRRSAAAEHALRIGTEVRIAPPPPGTPRIEGIEATTRVTISTTRPEEDQ